MCIVNMLKELVKERLNVAAEEIFALFERTISDYEEKLYRCNKENERRQQELVVAVADLRVELHKALQQQQNPTKPTFIKSEDAASGQDVAPLPTSPEYNGQLLNFEADNEPCEYLQSEPDSLFAPLSDGDITSNSSGANDDQEGNVTQHNGNKDFPCSQCEETFYSKEALKNHMATHEEIKVMVGFDKKFSLKHFVKRRKEKHAEPSEANKSSQGDVTDDVAGFEFNCSRCEKTFYSQNGLRKHMETHTRNKPFPCSVCDKRFFLKHHLKRHMVKHTKDDASRRKTFYGQNGLQKKHVETHTRNKPFLCSVCGKRFFLKHHLKRHMGKHTKDDVLRTGAAGRSRAPLSALSHAAEPAEGSSNADANDQCPRCGKKCSSNASLIQHMVIHTGEKPFTCSICGQGFSFMQSLQRHEKQHYGQNPFVCSVCRKGFQTRAQLIAHLKSHMEEAAALNSSAANQDAEAKADQPVGDDPHSEPDTDNASLNSSDTYYSDDDNEQPVKTKNKFKDMQQRPLENRDEPPHAMECPSGPDEDPLQGRRIEEEAPISDMDHDWDSEEEKPFANSFSPHGFSFKAPKFSFGAAYTESSQADDTQQADDQTEDFLDADKNWKDNKCFECNKTFASRAGLKRHMTQHTGEKPFKCLFCDKTFSLKEYLNRHVTIHTGWDCPTCGVNFLKRSAFIVHLRTHAGEKPVRSDTHLKDALEEPDRPKKHVVKDARLEKHVKNRIKNSEMNPTKCPICHKCFTDKGYIPKHMRLHTGEKPYQCTVCLQRFYFKYRINKHKCTGEKKSEIGEAGQADNSQTDLGINSHNLTS